ncbi:MAG: acetyl-CoA C-acetyltransferase [Spirochaetaceae bacterium]|nr:MAG: acetyl-CoA C-acetyltransferase [Spirochaetaceae bacterium]
MKDVIIAAATRTAVGSFGGSLAGTDAVQLGTTALTGALNAAGLNAEQLDEVIVGNILSTNLGQNLARQVAVNSGCPHRVPAYTVNKLCGSGLKSVVLGVQAIQLGDARVIAAGGSENMTMTPYAMPKARYGAKLGNTELVDLIMRDALTDAFDGAPMGETAERLADRFGISREEMDEFAAASQNKACAARAAGTFADEIVPVMIPQRKGDPIAFDTDEFPREGVTPEGLAGLKPAFRRDGGRVTAGNSSGINDGAAFVILCDADFAVEHKLPVLARIRSYGTAGVDPAEMGYGPVPATAEALRRAGMKLADIQLAELNEAFAAQSLSVLKGFENELGGIDPGIVNVNGGAIALGHPVGASGTRILVTLLHEMKRRDVQTGLASLCIGGGQGISMIVERS